MNEVILIFGKRGSGKTTLAKKLLLGKKRLVIFDTLREYKIGLVTDDIIELFEFLTQHEFNQVCRVSYSPEIDDKKAFGYVCNLVYSMKDLTFLVEEVDNYSTALVIPESFSKIIRYGRHQNISLIAVARRTAEVPRLLTSQATDFYVFAHHEPRDIEYFGHLFNWEVASKIRTLRQFQYIHLKPELAQQTIAEVTDE